MALALGESVRADPVRAGAGATGTGVELADPLTLAHASGSPVSNAAYSCVQPACVPVGQRFTARQPDDPLGTMSYQDGVIINGISAAGGSRWEDWSKLALDPTDDCTFRYFGGYGDSSRTGGPYFGRVGAFRLPTCRLDATGTSPTAVLDTAFIGPVATFTDSDTTASAAAFTARVDWGDGTRSDSIVSGGSGSFTVTASHTYSAVGPHTVTTSISGTDGSVASATSTAAVHYAFDGFVAPLGNPPAVSTVTAGGAVPVKFRLGGDQGLGVLAHDYPVLQPVSCGTTEPVSSPVTTAGSLQYDPKIGQYNYVRRTDGSWRQSCGRLDVGLVDDTVHSVYVAFK
jgi:hypothetical protein